MNKRKFDIHKKKEMCVNDIEEGFKDDTLMDQKFTLITCILIMFS